MNGSASKLRSGFFLRDFLFMKDQQNQTPMVDDPLSTEFTGGMTSDDSPTKICGGRTSIWKGFKQTAVGATWIAPILLDGGIERACLSFHILCFVDCLRPFGWLGPCAEPAKEESQQ